jgi:hypothetical protein
MPIMNPIGTIEIAVYAPAHTPKRNIPAENTAKLLTPPHSCRITDCDIITLPAIPPHMLEIN